MRASALLLAVVFAGCVGNAGDIELSRAMISFRGDGKSLALESAPLQEEGYRPTYPNPKTHQWVKVEVSSDARLVVACRTAERTDCADSPVTVSVEGGRVRAYDVYNVKLADIEYTGFRCRPTGGGAPNPTEGPGPAPAAGPPSMSEQMAGDPNVALALEDPGDVGGDDDDDDRDCPGEETPTVCTAPEARSEFCRGVNEGLTTYRLPAYDCAHLETAPSGPQPELDGEIACKRQIVTPAAERVRAAHPGCGELVRTWENNSLAEIRNTGMCGGSPLVLDLDGDGIQATSLSEGVRFDLFASGAQRSMAWLGGGDGLLVLDANHNGVIDDGTELFGQSTFAQSHQDGFAALAQLDANHDGAVDPEDPQFGELRVWVDSDHDGIGPAREWLTLPQAGVSSLSVQSHRVISKGISDGRGNWLPLRSHFGRIDGSRGQLVDVWFQVR